MRPIPPSAKAVLDGMLNDTIRVKWDGETFLARDVHGVSYNTRRVGREVKALRARGLLTEHGALTLTEAGVELAEVPDGADRAEIITAYRLRTAPPSVLRSEPLMPHPLYPAPEPRRITPPGDTYRTHVLTDHLVPLWPNETDGSNHDMWKVDATIRVISRGRHFDWHHVLFYGPDAAARRVTGGPLLKGVYATTYALGVVVDNHGGSARELQELKDAGKLFDVAIGDVIDIRGFLFVIESAPNDNITLTRMDMDGESPGYRYIPMT